MLTFKLRNTYEIDYGNDVIVIKGNFWANTEKDGKEDYVQETMDVEMSIKSCKYFLKVWIISEQGENPAVDLSQYEITHFRYDFDNRYVQFNNVQMAYGEAYILYEILVREINTDYFKFLLKDGFIIIYHFNGYLVITDDYCREALFFASFFKMARWRIEDDIFNNSKTKYKHKNKYELSKLTWYEVEYTSFCTWVTLGYRDMSMLFSFSDLKDLINTCKFLETYIYLREDGIL